MAPLAEPCREIGLDWDFGCLAAEESRQQLGSREGSGDAEALVSGRQEDRFIAGPWTDER
jgi:hypothetical protein